MIGPLDEAAEDATRWWQASQVSVMAIRRYSTASVNSATVCPNSASLMQLNFSLA
jgi:hypothetical protein